MSYKIATPQGHVLTLRYSANAQAMVVDCNFDPMALLRVIENDARDGALKGGWMIDAMHRDSAEGSGWFTLTGGHDDYLICGLTDAMKEALLRMEEEI